MKIKRYFIKNLLNNTEVLKDFCADHFPSFHFDIEGVSYEKAQARIDVWNKTDRDEKHIYSYRLDLPETEELRIEKPMKFKTYFRQKMKGCGSRQSVPQTFTFSFWDFDHMEIPRDDDGMDAEHALYYVNEENNKSQEWKYWLKIED